MEELDERAEKRFEEREERMRKFEMEMEEKRADREAVRCECLLDYFRHIPPMDTPKTISHHSHIRCQAHHLLFHISNMKTDNHNTTYMYMPHIL